MQSKPGKGLVIVILICLIALQAGDALATLYCNRTYSELTVNPGKPYNAVGFLNNGCTAFLIDANHIMAAAHCFVDTTTGAWQTGLRYYPNFHHDRVTSAPLHVPRADVTRAVVGSRAGESVLGVGMDWGIARVDNWQDTNNVDLTPLALAPSIPALGTALKNPAYTRHHFPFNDNDPITWDNMQFDSTQCSFVGAGSPTPGMWATLMRPAPFVDGVNRDRVDCNSRWSAGYIHGDCSLKSAADGVVTHNCDMVGGSSGSPFMFQSAGVWSVIGVGHGGGPTDFDMASRLAPVCTPDTPARWDNGGPSVERFRDAPRFAASIAVNRSPSNSSATAVFAVDTDRNHVVFRSRIGSAPTYASNFSYWKSLGTPLAAVLGGAKLTKVAACSDGNNKPQVFAIADNGQMFTRTSVSGIFSPTWTAFDRPNASTAVTDIDATTDASGRCMLLATAAGGGAFARAKTSNTTWGGWFTVASGSFKSISALNYAGAVWAAMVDTTGEIWRTSLGRAGWTMPTKLSRPAGVNAWRDLDFTWDEFARGFLVAIPTNAGNNVFFTPLYGNNAWSQWVHFDTHLWAPGAAAPVNAPTMQTVTASRWMEDPAGVTSPVIFGTDETGNVYFIEFSRVGSPGWVLNWKSFYHETIPRP